MELVDITTLGILLYSLILILNNTINIKILILKIKKNKKEALIGILLLMFLTGMYLNYRIIDKDKIESKLKRKLKLFNDAYISGLIALIIAYFAYIDKILPTFFFVFVLHYYLHLNE